MTGPGSRPTGSGSRPTGSRPAGSALDSTGSIRRGSGPPALPDSPSPRARQLRRLALALVSLVLLGLGWLEWRQDYAPRVRPEAPDVATFPASLLVNPAFDYALWIPWPHQNLGIAEDATGPLRDWLAAGAVLADAPVPSLPSFGFFSLPPARELVLAADSDSGRAVVAARVLPPVAWLARLSGRLADNPWLTGGEVDLRDRRAQVRWEAGVWIAEMEPVEQDSPLRPPREGEEDEEQSEAEAASSQQQGPERVPPPAPELLASAFENSALALFRNGREQASLPAGLYRLYAEEASGVATGDLLVDRLSTEALAPQLPPLPPALVEAPGALAGLGAGAPGEGQLHAFILFAPPNEGAGFALLNARPARRLPLQGLGLAVLLGEDGYSGQASGWYVMASGRENFQRGGLQVPLFASWLTEVAGSGQRPRFALVARPTATLRALEELQGSLDALQPASRESAVRLRALRRVLRPLALYPQATVTVSDNPVTYRLRLQAAVEDRP